MSNVVNLNDWQARKLGFDSAEELLDIAADELMERKARLHGFESFDQWAAHEFQVALEFVGLKVSRTDADGPFCCVLTTVEHCQCGRMIEDAGSDHCIDCGRRYEDMRLPDPPEAA